MQTPFSHGRRQPRHVPATHNIKKRRLLLPVRHRRRTKAMPRTPDTARERRGRLQPRHTRRARPASAAPHMGRGRLAPRHTCQTRPATTLPRTTGTAGDDRTTHVGRGRPAPRRTCRTRPATTVSCTTGTADRDGQQPHPAHRPRQTVAVTTAAKRRGAQLGCPPPVQTCRPDSSWPPPRSAALCPGACHLNLMQATTASPHTPPADNESYASVLPVSIAGCTARWRHGRPAAGVHSQVT